MAPQQELSSSSTVSSTSSATSPPTQPSPGLKPCCACPDTKRARDECIFHEGEENCKDLIEAHKASPSNENSSEIAQVGFHNGEVSGNLYLKERS
ncbi:9870_t:CDS:2 [Paraglomus occultum]|uniref:9870_t:CDS:1 n=1 Tax=Paraglomus occultum TaxID=144539 RepID=A0A9N9BT25_9GLOM|nr:9870_t:CDS:2 [Paraglomus occultum]